MRSVYKTDTLFSFYRMNYLIWMVLYRRTNGLWRRWNTCPEWNQKMSNTRDKVSNSYASTWWRTDHLLPNISPKWFNWRKNLIMRSCSISAKYIFFHISKFVFSWRITYSYSVWLRWLSADVKKPWRTYAHSSARICRAGQRALQSPAVDIRCLRTNIRYLMVARVLVGNL